MKKRTIIFGNGVLHPLFLKEVKAGDYIIGVDRAAYWLITNGVIPHLAIGDFDSVTQRQRRVIEKKAIETRAFPAKKDKTDMELAIQEAQGDTVVFGWSGRRMDHTLAALHVGNRVTFVDTHNRMRVIAKGRTIFKPSSYTYFSILPITTTIILSIRNALYNLSKTRVSHGSTLTVSNKLKGRPGVIDLFAGKAWLIESRD